MELFEALHQRRSVRQFTNEPVSEAQIKQVLSAAMMAPSAGNAQPWQFIVVTDRKLLHKTADIHPYAGMARDAAAGILVCGDNRLEKYPGNWVADCSAATQNLLLALHGIGLGGVWVGIFPNKEREKLFRLVFNLPDEVIPLAYVPFGVPAMNPPSSDRFDEGKVHHNGW